MSLHSASILILICFRLYTELIRDLKRVSQPFLAWTPCFRVRFLSFGTLADWNMLTIDICGAQRMNPTNFGGVFIYTTVVQTKISQQLFDGLLWNLVQVNLMKHILGAANNYYFHCRTINQLFSQMID